MIHGIYLYDSTLIHSKIRFKDPKQTLLLIWQLIQGPFWPNVFQTFQRICTFLVFKYFENSIVDEDKSRKSASSAGILNCYSYVLFF